MSQSWAFVGEQPLLPLLNHFFHKQQLAPCQAWCFSETHPFTLLLFKAAGPGSNWGPRAEPGQGSLHAEKSFLSLTPAEED